MDKTVFIKCIQFSLCIHEKGKIKTRKRMTEKSRRIIFPRGWLTGQFLVQYQKETVWHSKERCQTCPCSWRCLQQSYIYTTCLPTGKHPKAGRSCQGLLTWAALTEDEFYSPPLNLSTTSGSDWDLSSYFVSEMKASLPPSTPPPYQSTSLR